MATDSTGSVSEYYDYYPYGGDLTSTQLGATSAKHTFTDKEYDDSAGLFYFEARYYNPAIGRFVSQDPMQYAYDPKGKSGVTSLLGNPQALNYYSYASNNPVNLTDPTGMLTTAGAVALVFVPGYMAIYNAGLGLSYGLLNSNPITANFLYHSLTLNPTDITITEKNQSSWGNVIDKIKGTDEFQTAIDGMISAAESSGQATIGGSDGYATMTLDETSDLKMSLDHTEMNVTGSQGEDGSWDLNVSVTDTYHFNSDFDYNTGSAYEAMNNVASGAQQAGMISTYDETIKFSTHHD